MLRELTQDAIIDFFKNELRTIPFVSATDYTNIEQRLDVLVNTAQNRYRKIEAAKWIWKYFVETSLSDITNNLRGYSDLCSYFDQFVEYENLLFALDKNHRDHTIHSVWVMLIGFYIRKFYPSLTNFLYGEIFGSVYPKALKPNPVVQVKKMLKSHEESLWCLIALTHDLGYPIEKTGKANEIMSKMISNFGFLEQREFKYSFTVVHQTAIDALLDIVSSAVMFTTSKNFCVATETGHRLDYAKSFEKLDHGIMSAYLIMIYIDYICDKWGVFKGLPPESQYISQEEAAQKGFIIDWLGTIATHTDDYRYSYSVDSMGELLILSDELDEFSRYSRSLTSNDWLSTGCRTMFDCTKSSLRLNYTFDNKDIGDDLESFFKWKVKRLYSYFELRKYELERIFVTCTDIRKALPISLNYEKSLSKYSEGIVKSSMGKSSSNIREYLEGTESLL